MQLQRVRLDRLERKLEYSSKRDLSANSGSNSPGRGTNLLLLSVHSQLYWRLAGYPKKLLNSQSADALDDTGLEPYIPQSLSHTDELIASLVAKKR